MKKFLSIISTVLFVFFFTSFQACLAWDGDPGWIRGVGKKELLNAGFVMRVYTTPQSKKYDEGTILLSLTPKTKGRKGDGFVVANFYKEFDRYGRMVRDHLDYYFLPEGEILPLDKNDNYKLNAARAYKIEDGGLVVGEAKWLRIGGAAYTVGTKTLPLSSVEGDFKLMYSPRILNNFESGEIVVRPRSAAIKTKVIIYSGLKVYCDDLSGTEVFILDPERGGTVDITNDMSRCYALSFIQNGGRVIQTNSSSIYFDTEENQHNDFDEEYRVYMEEYTID